MPQAPGAPVDTPVRAPRGGLLSWPPPGLGRVQGELLPALAVSGLGGLILVAPLLWAVAADQPPRSLGPWGGGWWFPILTTVFGLSLLLIGVGLLFRILLAARGAVTRGHDRRTVWLAAADWRRDTGFLIQGARMYSEMSPGVRESILRTRLWGARLLLFAVLWLPGSFGASVLLAARGWVDPTTMLAVTVGPALVAFLGGVLALAWGRLHLARTGRAWERRPGVAEERRAQIADWREQMERLPVEGRPRLGPGGGAGFRLAPAALVLLFLLVAVPVVALVLAASVGPILGAVAVPHYAGVHERAGAAEPLRAYRLGADGSISPQVAGEAVQTLAYVGGGGEVDEMETPPARRYAEGWFPMEGPDGIHADVPPGELMRRAAAGLDAEVRGYLERVAAHPAQSEIETLARAPRADLASARWRLPLPEEAGYLGLPIPRLRALREGARAHLAQAALQLDAGDVGAAEETVREVISTGLLLADEGPSLIDNMVGLMVAETGGDALQGLYRATGREDQAQTVERAREASARAARLTAPGSEVRDVSRTIEELSFRVTAPGTLRGVRWEQYALVNTLAPCLNLHNVVFGPGEEHRDWRSRARVLLVRYPSEEHLFRLADRGWFGRRAADDRRSPLSRFLSFTLGEGEGSGGCADLVDAASTATGS